MNEHLKAEARRLGRALANCRKGEAWAIVQEETRIANSFYSPADAAAFWKIATDSLKETYRAPILLGHEDITDMIQHPA